MSDRILMFQIHCYLCRPFLKNSSKIRSFFGESAVLSVLGLRTIKGIVTVFIYLITGFAAWPQPLCAEANLDKLTNTVKQLLCNSENILSVPIKTNTAKDFEDIRLFNEIAPDD